jgi:hypothetical protein
MERSAKGNLALSGDGWALYQSARASPRDKSAPLIDSHVKSIGVTAVLRSHDLLLDSARLRGVSRKALRLGERGVCQVRNFIDKNGVRVESNLPLKHLKRLLNLIARKRRITLIHILFLERESSISNSYSDQTLLANRNAWRPVERDFLSLFCFGENNIQS